jgi:hypothetical protein
MKFKAACLLALALSTNAFAEPLSPETDRELYAGVCSLVSLEAARLQVKEGAEYDEMLASAIIAVLSQEKVKSLNLDKAKTYFKKNKKEAYTLYTGCSNSIINAFLVLDEEKRIELATKADSLLETLADEGAKKAAKGK